MRCFIGLPTESSVIPLIQDVQKKAKRQDPHCRVVPSANFHVTLAFIGEIERSLALKVAREVKSMSHFTGANWVINRSGYFPRPKVAWVGGDKTEELVRLAREARLILDKLKVPYDAGSFKPHITILRKANLQEPVLFDAFNWPIQEALLFESTLSSDGKRIYRPVDPD